MKLAILGAGSVRCSLPVIATLATFFGERPLEIRLYDADEERLDLFDRFARFSFEFNEAPHKVLASSDAAEMLEGANRVLLQVDENCARKLIRERLGSFPGAALSRGEVESTALEYLIDEKLGERAEILSLQRKEVRIPVRTYSRVDWPGEVDERDRRAIPHQILRWIRGEEYLYDLYKQYDKTPLKDWLNDVTTAPLVSEN